MICALENVERHDWLDPGSKPTPDLEVVIDGDLVTVEVTMHTVGQELWGAAEKMRSPERSGRWPQRTPELSHKWKVNVSDHSLDSRDRNRPLKELVKALVSALAIVESTDATPEVMQQRANEILNPDRYNPNLPGPESWWFVDGWPEAAASGVDHSDFLKTRLDQRCRYWYPPDIFDWLTEGWNPRRARVWGSPRAANAGSGGVTVYVSTGQGCLLEAVDELVPAIQDAINHKAGRGQMANVTGKKWLVVALDGGSASMQLEELCSKVTHPPDSEINGIQFPDFDEVWAFSRTFDGARHAVLRLSHSDPARCFTVPRISNASQT